MYKSNFRALLSAKSELNFRNVVQKLGRQLGGFVVKESKKRLLPENLVIGKDRLFLLIDEYKRGIKSEHGWPAPAGILVSVTLCLFVTDRFVPFLMLTADQTRLLVYLLGIASFLWLGNEILKSRFGSAQEKLESEILESIKNAPDFTVIYLIKLTKDQVPRVLVEWKDSWDCYFLPYVARNQRDDFSTQSLTALQKTVASYLGISSDAVSIDHLRDYSFISEKYSPKDKVHKQYNFDFFFFSVPKEKMIENYTSSPFTVGGKTYFWKTISELMADVKTMANNGDVVSHLEKNYSSLVVGTGESFR